MIALTTVHRICEHLEKYIFDRIWNEPYSEYRSHIVPQILNDVRTEKVDGFTVDKDGVVWSNGQIVDDSGTWSGKDFKLSGAAELHQLVNDRTTYIPVAGMYRGRYCQTQLPVSSNSKKARKFYIYSVPKLFFRSIQLNVRSGWAKLSEYCNKYCVDITFFTDDGTVIWRDGIYITQMPKNDGIFVIVDSDVFHACAGKTADPSKVLFGKYYDSDNKPDNEISCLQLAVRPSQDYNPIPSDATIAFCNGRVVSGEDYKAFMNAGDYIEVVKDEDVIGKLTVPCCHDCPEYVYGENHPRILVHIPKTINTKNELITPNTCDMYLIPDSMENGKTPVAGINLYTAGRGEHFHQLSHSDFSIDKDWIETIASEHGFIDYHLLILVRTHNKEKTVVRDVNYLDLLYNHTDEQIIDILLGRDTKPAECGIYFWSAQHLEDSLYSDALQRRRNTFPSPLWKTDPSTGKKELTWEQCKDCGLRDRCTIRQKIEYTGDSDLAITNEFCPMFNRRSIENFVDILGYFTTLSLIARRISHFRILKDGANQVTITVPLALSDLKVNDFFLVVYHNGFRLEPENFNVTETSNTSSAYTKELRFVANPKFSTNVIQDNYCSHARITIDKNVYKTPIKEGDVIAVEIYDNFGDHHFSDVHPRRYWATFPEHIFQKTQDVAFEPGKDYYEKVEDVDALPDPPTPSLINKVKRVMTGEDRNKCFQCKEVEVESGTVLSWVLVYPDHGPTYIKVAVPYGDTIPYGTHYYEYVPNPTNNWLQEVKSETVEVVRVDDNGKYQKIELSYLYYKTSDIYFQENKDYFLRTGGSGTPDDIWTYEKTDVTPGQPIPEGSDYYNRVDVLDADEMILTIPEDHFNRDEDLLFIEGPTAVEDTEDFNLHESFTGFATQKDVDHYRELANYLEVDVLPAPTKELFGQKVKILKGSLTNKFFKCIRSKGVEENYEWIETCLDVVIPELDKEYYAFGPLCSEIYQSDVPEDLYPYDSELVFLNHKRLARGLDYSMDGYTNRDEPYVWYDQVNLYMQNVSYLTEFNDRVSVIRSNVTILANSFGFVDGDIVNWGGEDPSWFDGLSTLSVEGELCSDFTEDLGTIKINNLDHYRNGAPYEIRTAVSTRALEILNDYKKDVDRGKLSAIQAYFKENSPIPLHRTIVPYAHKIYSIYLEKIARDFIEETDPKKRFKMLEDDKAFVAQFDKEPYRTWKTRDIVFNSERITDHLKYIDIYMSYHRFRVNDRSEYAALARMTHLLSPVDDIKHRDAINV